MHEYNFMITADDDKGLPFGPVNKDNMDISRLIIDFTCWLDPSESITLLEHLLITSELPATIPPWRSNYPLDGTTTIPVLVDTYPLTFYRNNLIQEGKAVVLDMASGTPGMTYAVSFVAQAGVSLRKREVDILVVIDQPLNPLMVDLAPSIPLYDYPLFITMTTALPLGFGGSIAVGRVYINNQTAAPMTVVLPPSPILGDRVDVLDYGETASLYPVTFIGATGSEAFSIPGVEFISNVSGDDLTFEWTGAYWAIGTKLYPILG
jgi:hypothetical protein